MFKDRIVAVMNKSIEPGKAMNALAHMSLGIAAKSNRDFSLMDFKCKDDHILPGISQRPYVILKAPSNKVKKLVQIAIQESIEFRAFTESMTGGTWEEQSEKTREANLENHEFYGIVMLGDSDKITELTKKFSLWKI